MTTAPRVACSTCCYWQRPDRQSYGFDGDRVQTGQCRRMPPIPMMTEKGLRATWPLTLDGHWCGEHGRVDEALK